jgi:hypothetical protein
MRPNFDLPLSSLQPMSRSSAVPPHHMENGISPVQHSEPRPEEAKSFPNAIERLNFDAQPYHVM